MAQSKTEEQGKKEPDISNCRVRRLDNGWLICMMKRDCPYLLPYGNICSHSRAGEMVAEGD